MIEKIKDNIPLLTATLIFIGYLKYHFFYTHFDLEISSFLSTTELIFSFLPLTIPFLFITISILFFIISIILSALKQEKNKSSESETTFDNLISIPRSWDSLSDSLSTKKKNLSYGFTLIKAFILFLMSIVVRLFLFAYPFLILYNAGYDKQFIGFEGCLTLGIIWIIFIFIQIDEYEKEEKRKGMNVLGHILLICLSILLLWIDKKSEAKDILSGKPIYDTKFNYNGSTISTNSNILFVGQTSNYIFLRNIKTKENIIFKMDDITNFTLKKRDEVTQTHKKLKQDETTDQVILRQHELNETKDNKNK